MKDKRRHADNEEDHHNCYRHDRAAYSQPRQPLIHNERNDEHRQRLKLRYRARLVPKDSVPVDDLRDHTDDGRENQHAQRHPADCHHPRINFLAIKNRKGNTQRTRDQHPQHSRPYQRNVSVNTFDSRAHCFFFGRNVEDEKENKEKKGKEGKGFAREKL